MYKIIIQWHGSATSEVRVATLSEATEKVKEILLQRHVRGMPFISPLTHDDVCLDKYKKEWVVQDSK